jgi:hypothetical protein
MGEGSVVGYAHMRLVNSWYEPSTTLVVSSPLMMALSCARAAVVTMHASQRARVTRPATDVRY